jgi:hypothetical protein
MHAENLNLVGKALRGVGVGVTPAASVKTSQAAAAEPTPTAHQTQDRSYVCTQEHQAEPRRVKWFEASQFFKPRKARNASPVAEFHPLSPRSSRSEIECRSKFNLALVGQHRRVRPNPSLKASPNSVAHWSSSAGPAAHFALAVQRATLSVPP